MDPFDITVLSLMAIILVWQISFMLRDMGKINALMKGPAPPVRKPPDRIEALMSQDWELCVRIGTNAQACEAFERHIESLKPKPPKRDLVMPPPSITPANIDGKFRSAWWVDSEPNIEEQLIKNGWTS